MGESFIVIAYVMGVVELLKRLKDQDYWGGAVIAAAALIGGLTGFFGVDGLTLVEGIRQGLAAAGLFRVAQAVAGDRVIE